MQSGAEIDEKNIIGRFAQIVRQKLDGCWTIQYRETERSIYFKQGIPVFAESNASEDRFLRLITDWGHLSKAEYVTHLKGMRSSDKPVGEYLVENSVIPADQLDGLLKKQIQTRIIRTLAIRYAENSFDESKMSDTIQPLHPIQVLCESIPYRFNERAWKNEVSALESAHLQLVPDHANALKNILSKHTTALNILKSAQNGVRAAKVLSGLESEIGKDSASKLIVALRDLGTLLSDSGAVASKSVELVHENKSKSEEVEALYEEMRSKNALEILEIDKTATDPVVKKAYFKLAKKYHPDKYYERENNRNNESAEKLFALIQQSYDDIRTKEKRDRYIQFLETGMTQADAVEQAQKIMESEITFQKAEVLVRRRKYDEAYELFQQACELNPDEAEFLAKWGWTEFVHGWPDDEARHQAGLDKLERAFELRATADIAYSLGRIAKIKDDSKTAIKQFRKALEIDKKHVEAHKELEKLQKAQ